MNRIRKYDDKYQVIITPSHRFHTGVELLLGGWTDPSLKNYKILEFPTMNDALVEAYKHPDIDWFKLSLMHKDIFYNLKNKIRSVLDDNNFIVDFYPQLKTPEQIKDIMFDRVMYFGKRFTLTSNLNDICVFHIVNPYYANLDLIHKALVNTKCLRITKKIIHQGVIHLVGETDLGTSYEICLWTSLIFNWAKWASNNPKLSQETKENTLNQVIESQKKVDDNYEL